MADILTAEVRTRPFATDAEAQDAIAALLGDLDSHFRGARLRAHWTGPGIGLISSGRMGAWVPPLVLETRITRHPDSAAITMTSKPLTLLRTTLLHRKSIYRMFETLTTSMLRTLGS